MNARPYIKPATIGAATKDGRAYERDLVNGPARHERIGPAPIDWRDVAAKVVIAVLGVVSFALVATQ